MTTTSNLGPSVADDHAGVIVRTEPMFSVGERTALAGFLAGYSGLTRDAYALDLRQYVSGANGAG